MAGLHKASTSLMLAAAMLVGYSSAGFGADAPAGEKPNRPEHHEGGPGGKGPGGEHGGPDHGRPGKGGPLGALKQQLKDLGLSDEQQQQINEMIKKAGEEIRAIQEEERARVKAVDDELRSNVMAQLDDTQKAALQKKMDEQPRGGPGMRPEGPPPEGDQDAPPPPEGGSGGPGGRAGMMEQRMMEVLADQNLTQEQQDQIHAIFENAREEGRKIAEENQDDREARREAMRAFGNDVREKIKAVLTPEQAAAVEQKIKERREQGGDRPRPREREEN